MPHLKRLGKMEGSSIFTTDQQGPASTDRSKTRSTLASRERPQAPVLFPSRMPPRATHSSPFLHPDFIRVPQRLPMSSPSREEALTDVRQSTQVQGRLGDWQALDPVEAPGTWSPLPQLLLCPARLLNGELVTWETGFPRLLAAVQPAALTRHVDSGEVEEHFTEGSMSSVGLSPS